jgi:hypothetical protein
MKTERYVGHPEAREALVLSVTSVTAIMLAFADLVVSTLLAEEKATQIEWP